MAQRIVTPIGELKWIFITGQGKKDLNGKDRFVASVSFPADSTELAQVKNIIETFWKDNKPKGKVKPKSNGIREEFIKDENGDSQPTGNYLINFWTGTTFKDGKPKVIKTMNAKGAEVALGGRKIGNGSRGAISGAMDIYQNGPNVGVTLYLNAIQLTRFIEFADDAGFEAQDDAEAWTGEELNEDGFEAQESDKAAQSNTPKISL